MFWPLVGSAGAALTMLAFVPQIVKVARSKSAKDISVFTLFQLLLGVSFWIAYGMHLKDAIIILANSITLLSLIILLFLYFYYRRIKS